MLAQPRAGLSKGDGPQAFLSLIGVVFLCKISTDPTAFIAAFTSKLIYILHSQGCKAASMSTMCPLKLLLFWASKWRHNQFCYFNSQDMMIAIEYQSQTSFSELV